MRPPAAVLAALVLLAGCGEEGSVTGEVRSAVEAFGEATGKKDYQRICDDLLSKELIANVEQIGLPCEVAWKQSLGSVRAPKLEIKTVAVNDDRALVAVRSTARGQRPSDDTLELVREGDGWRIAALAKPQPQKPATARP